MRVKVLSLLATLSVASAWVPHNKFSRRASTQVKMAIDYNDPVVSEEFTKVQPMTYEDVEAELRSKGITVAPTMNEMDVKLMLVEMRLRLGGKLGGKKEAKRPDKFSNKFEEAVWTKPAFKEFYNGIKSKGDQNAMNVVIEYVTNKDVALQRYGKDYKSLIRKCEQALNAPPPVTGATLVFKGFPANMGEAACKMTLESLGAVKDFQCEQDEDFPILKGKVTFESIESAKKAIAQYNGMDMGLGTKLEVASA